jgi:hypothetical protein
MTAQARERPFQAPLRLKLGTIETVESQGDNRSRRIIMTHRTAKETKDR